MLYSEYEYSERPKENKNNVETCTIYKKKKHLRFPRQLLKEKGLDNLTLEGHIEHKIIERNGEQGIWRGRMAIQ